MVGLFVCIYCAVQEEADVRLAIQEALSMMVGAYANLQGALLNLMEALVAAYISKVEYTQGQQRMTTTVTLMSFPFVRPALAIK